MLLYGLGINPAMRDIIAPRPGQMSRDPDRVLKPLTEYDKCLKAHLQAPCGGAKNIIEAKARCDANTPPPTCGGGAEGDGGEGGGGEGGGGDGAEPGFFAKHKTKLLIGGGLLAAYLVLRR